MTKTFTEKRCGHDRRNHENRQVEEIINFFVTEEDERRKIKDRRKEA